MTADETGTRTPRDRARQVLALAPWLMVGLGCWAGVLVPPEERAGYGLALLRWCWWFALALAAVLAGRLAVLVAVGRSGSGVLVGCAVANAAFMYALGVWAQRG